MEVAAATKSWMLLGAVSASILILFYFILLKRRLYELTRLIVEQCKASFPKAAHTHRTVDNSRIKESKQAFQDPRFQDSGIQPSTSKGGKKVPPHLMQVEVSADKIGKKKKLIPKIIVTGPSEEVLINSFTDELPETKTIRESDYTPFTVHSKPSTVDAYRMSKEQ